DNIEKIPLVLKQNKQELIFVRYDKSVFYSNNRKREIWIPDRNMPLRKKGNERSIMVSKFFLEEYKQIRDKAISIFEAKFSNTTAVFAFDNSTNYRVYTEDTLIAIRMNLKLRENQLKIFEEDEDYDENM
ncbi:8103_t:CDS:2, partial [Scutellospora calospora]